MEIRIIWFFLVVYYCMAAGCLTMAATQTNSDISTDQSALLALKARITSDPQNMILTNWSTTTPVCNWVGVTCAALHHRVAVLNLSYMGLTGTIPPELGNLSFLVELRFRNNSFYGTLPPELARLRRLKVLSFLFNNFMGTIPPWIGSLSKLQGLYLYGNQFSGSIPATLFNLSALQVIKLSYNQLSGSIPREIGNLTMLKELYLDSNHFKEIPKEIGTLDQLEKLFAQLNDLKGVPLAHFNMSSLTILALYQNKLNGSLPDNICQHFPSIQYLYLDYNQFDGSLPSKWSQCKQLLLLTLGNNSLSGCIPTNIGDLTQINTIDLGSNYLTGSMPASIFNLPTLEVIDLTYNQLSGTIPRKIGNLTMLKEIYLDSNNFKGTMPDEIGHLPKLDILSITANNLNGVIPSSIFNMSTITVVSLVSNQLSGSLPTNMGFGLPNLQELYLGGNKLSGVIPKSISNASKLIILDMPRNLFYGFIPRALCALTNLQELSLFQNNLTIDTSTPEVNFLSCLANLRNFTELDLTSNPLNAKLSISFRNLSTSLQYIFLGNCNMRGNIPNDIGNLSNLTILGLQQNQLSGSIPTSIGRPQNLQILSLDDNKLQGQIPDELCQLINLGALYLDGNQLSGGIPSCLGHLAITLRFLLLSSNLLNSTIPSTLWGLTDILQLDLSSNSFIGPLSESVGNLKVITNIDLSNNQLSGSIPNSIGSLQNLVNLSLANNELKGPIPSSLGNSLSLERLDLSKNNLFGVIPKSLEALSYLNYLNVSFNRLQGEIPTGGPFKHLSAQSFVSNNGLCGASRFLVSSCKRKSSRTILKYVILGILSAMLLVTSIWILIIRKKKNVKTATETTFLPQLQLRRVSYHDLLSATNGFNECNLLGSGGFGSVYKGTLSDGMEVAVKVFNLEFEGAFISFEVECEMLSNVRHRNLVKVVSCCSQIDFKALVLNYMSNGSLEKWLYSHNCSLNILQRLDIMIDVASALEYLHYGCEVPIIHCDLKPSNILLDDEMGAHVADFGIAKLLGGRDSITQTMTLATIGYMAPEYGMDGIVTRRGDVFSFGIVVMETFTRRKPTDEIFAEEMRLKQWVANSLATDAIVEVVDTNLLGIEEDHDLVSKRECLSSIMRLALACSVESPEERINMQEALITLKKIKIKFLKDAEGGVEDSWTIEDEKKQKVAIKSYIDEYACADQSTSTENWEHLKMN